VASDGKQIDAKLVDVNNHLADRLRCIGVDECADALHLSHDFGDRL
jgi:hypothetical protein